MAGRASQILEWLRERSGVDHIPFYRVPYNYFNLDMWLGGIVAASFFWLAITGLLLLFYYDPTNPLESTKKTIFERPFGAVLLTSHLYAAHFMIIAIFIHAFRNLFKGAYKRPRELVWILGVITGFTALQTAFFGYSLVGDRIAVEAVNIGVTLNLRSFGEQIGLYIVSLLFGLTPEERYFRLLANHVLFATLVFLLFLLHFGLFEMHGPAPREEESKWRVRPFRIDQKRRDLAPWFPVNAVFIASITFTVWGLILVVAGLAQTLAEYLPPLFSPYPVEAEDFIPMPPWFFLFAYRIFQFVFLTFPHPEIPQILQFLVAMVLPPLILIALPFIDRSESKHPLDRPGVTVLGGLMIIYFTLLTIWSLVKPGIPIGLLQASIVMIPPASVLVAGVYLLRRIWVGATLTTGHYVAAGSFAIGLVVLPILLALAAGVAGVYMVEAALGILGAGMSALLVGWLASKMSEGRMPEVMESVEDPDSNVPSYLLGVAVAEFAVLVFALVSLSMIAIIDPVGSAAQATAMLGLAFLFGGALAYQVFRALVADRLPMADAVTELKPHALPFLALVLVVLIVL